MSAMVIVGAGECGTRAAFALRESGWDGEIVLLGGESGLPYERPPLSKPGVDGQLLKPICDEARLAEAKIDYRHGVQAIAISRDEHRLWLADGPALSYRKLLLATGAEPRALTCPGANSALLFRTHADAQAVFQRVRTARHALLVGAGLIGMELAASLRSAGLQVTVVEAGPRALGRAVPAVLAERLLDRHAAAGVDIRLATGIEKLEAGQALLSDGSAIATDMVLAAIGVVPHTALAAAAGLEVDNGIVVDHRLATADADIFAAGDCARVPTPHAAMPMRLESWRNAQEQGVHAARSMLGADAAFDAVPWFWSDQYELGLQIAGLPDPALPNFSRRIADDAEILFQLASDGRLLSASGLGRGNAVAKDIRLAEMLIARGASPSSDALCDPAVNLKTLLRA